MAKWGEGDPRWLVEERPDATNPNNWHWVEKNATGWSKDRLTELFIGQSLTVGSLKVDFVEFAKLDGEATTNNRKAKLIFLFEWFIHLKFNAHVTGSDVEYKGILEIPNLSDENEASEVDITVTIETKGPHEAELRQALSSHGLNFVRDKCEVYIRELKEEFSRGLILPTDRTKPQAVATKAKTTVSVNKQAFQNEVITEKNTPKSSISPMKVSSVKSLNISEGFKAPPERLYEILTMPEFVKAWGGRDAKVESKEGGTFSILGGQISGTFVKLNENELIETKWRLKKYPEGHYANVKLTLSDQNDSTSLIVEANDIPEEHFSDTQIGFQRYYFQNVSRTFGIGLNLF